MNLGVQEISVNRNRDLSLVIPTFNERANIAALVAGLESALTSYDWEVIFVDDNSPDGTADTVRMFASTNARIRLIQRIGRRGLSSACIEGIRASGAPLIAVMDADLQHDESKLPPMIEYLRSRELDVVVGTRNAQGGSMGDFSVIRVALSQIGRILSRLVTTCPLSDPMSGFFIVRRSFFLEVSERLDGRGFKILLDMLAASSHRVQVGEVGYRFRGRTQGTSKLGAGVMLQFLAMVIRKIASRRSRHHASASPIATPLRLAR